MIYEGSLLLDDGIIRGNRKTVTPDGEDGKAH